MSPGLVVMHNCNGVQERSGLLTDLAVMCDCAARVSLLALAG